MKINFANILLVFLVFISLAAVFVTTRPVGDVACDGEEGVIFTDCIDPSWRGISSWEMFESNYESISSKPNNGDLVEWQVVPADVEQRGKVIDIRYSDALANGRVRFHTSKPGQVKDMSAYATGTIEFDVRVLDWGRSDRALVVRVVCGYPCASGPVRIQVPGTGEWHTIKLAIAQLVDDGLELDSVDIGLAISPTWNRMQGVHFQMDNIRWVKGAMAEQTDVFVSE
ncbi:beta-glucosidase [Alteromonadaceae bacterium Bs31]|nr:beta-glucosidase [Alteromonadaceae bacterium Bs31]